MRVRVADLDEIAAVLNVLDGAALATDHGRVRTSVERDEALVADSTADGDGTVLGALVLDGDRIETVAVRRNRRGQGIGTALVAAAKGRRDRLVAEFDADVRPFYEELMFDVEPADASDRYRGVFEK